MIYQLSIFILLLSIILYYINISELSEIKNIRDKIVNILYYKSDVHHVTNDIDITNSNIVHINSYIIHGLSTPSSKYQFIGEDRKLYDFVNGLDSITESGIKQMLNLGKYYAETFKLLLTNNENVSIRAYKLNKCVDSGEKLLKGMRKYHHNIQDINITTLSTINDFLLNSHSLCQNINKFINITKYATSDSRRLQYSNKLTLERFTDIGRFTRPLHVFDLPKIAEIAEYRYNNRNSWLKEHHDDYHWERMQEFLMLLLKNASEQAKRLMFQGLQSIWIGGNILRHFYAMSTGRVLSTIDSKLVFNSLSKTDKSFNFLIGEEEPLFAILTLLDVFNNKTQESYVDTPHQGSHFEMLTTKLGIRFDFDKKSLVHAPLCVSSILRLTKDLKECCTNDEFEAFLIQHIEKAIDRNYIHAEYAKGEILVEEQLKAFVDFNDDDQISKMFAKSADDLKNVEISKEEMRLIYPDTDGVPLDIDKEIQEKEKYVPRTADYSRPDSTPSFTRFVNVGSRSEHYKCPFEDL